MWRSGTGMIAAVGMSLAMAPVRATEPVAAAASQVIPSSRCRGLWLVPLLLEGQTGEPLHLVLDTGASVTSIDPDALARVTGRPLTTGKKIMLRGASLGPLRFRKLRARTHHMDHLARALGTPMDGIIGFPAFRDLLLTLDYPAEEIRVARGRLPDTDGLTIFADLGKQRPYLHLELGGLRLPVLLDSGFAGGLTLHEDDDLPWTVEPLPVSASVRYAGIHIVRMGRLDGTSSLGPLRLEHPYADITDGTRLAGAEILQGVVATFDQKERRMRLVTDAAGPLRLAPRRGMGAAVKPVAAGQEVVRIFPGTPAEAAGLLPGDLIVAIDGVPVHERGCRRPEDDAGCDRVTLTLRRAGGADQEVEVGIVLLVQ